MTTMKQKKDVLYCRRLRCFDKKNSSCWSSLNLAVPQKYYGARPFSSFSKRIMALNRNSALLLDLVMNEKYYNPSKTWATSTNRTMRQFWRLPPWRRMDEDCLPESWWPLYLFGGAFETPYVAAATLWLCLWWVLS